MATPSARQTPNPSSATTGSAPSRTRDLSSLRNAEPGSAFRGMTKSRGGSSDRGGGRGGHRGGRGGRGTNGRGKAESGTPKADPTPLKVEVPAETKPAAATAGPSNPAAEKPSPASASSEKASKPKIPSRRGSRNVPALVIAPSSPTVESAPTSATRSRNSRKRPQQGKGPGTPVRQSLLIDSAMAQSSVRPQKARTGPPTPTVHKDIPPHLSAAPDVTTFDMKHDIDVLVERMRAAAMSDTLRPSTPGSHIDWAGDDDDDSLPDLPDWGVTTSVSKVAVEMSPILVDHLKPLPEAAPQINSDQPEKGPITLVPLPQKSIHAPKPTLTPAPAKASQESTKKSLHPSLPAKPAAALPKSSGKPSSRPVAAPVRVLVPILHPAPAEKPHALPEPPVATAEEVPASVKHSPTTAIVKLPSSNITVEPTIAISAAEPAADEDLTLDHSSDRNGLSASIHAPSPVSESASSPSLSSTNLLSTPTGPRSFHPTHQRAHTVGRSPNINQTQTPPSAHQRFPRSGGTRGGSHGRTHSSPPAGSGLNPRVHTQRPTITLDALSRLAKTITSGPSTRAKEIPTTTE